MRIFISYGRKDSADFALKLFKWLKEQGYNPWLDIENGIPPGSNFDILIETAISDSKLLIALLSPWSLREEGFCRKELLYAQNKKVAIIPIRIADITPPIQIISLDYIDAYDNPELVFSKLPPVIEQVVKSGSMPLKEWPYVEGNKAWWASYRQLTFEEEMAKHGAAFVGREWLFTQIQEWLNQRSFRLLLLTADVGVGKSAIVSQMTTRLNVRGVHFCSRSKTESCGPVAWLAGLIYQLAVQFTAYRTEIEKLNSPNWGNPPESLFRTLISEPLHICQKQLNVNANEPWVFVIDSLDESMAVAGTALADLLTDSVKRIPDWLRLIVTSRPDQTLIARFRIDGVKRHHLDAKDKQNNEDLASYIKKRVREMVDKTIIPNHQDSIHKLSELAAGNFLYAKTTLDALSNTEYCLNLDELGKLPTTLGGLYCAMFKIRFCDIDKYETEVLPLLDCLVAALGSLPENLLLVASKLDQRTALKGLLILSQFIDKNDAGLRLFHQSLADWLSDYKISAEYAASLSNGHKRLAEACWSEFKAGVQNMSSYAVAHLPIHLLESKRMDNLLELVQNLGMNLITKWTEGEDGDRGIRCLTELIKYLDKNNSEPATAVGLATQVARIYSLRGKYDEAKKWLEYALTKTSWLRRRRIRSIALHELGSLYLYKGDINQSNSYYRKALRLCLWGKPIYHDEAAANFIGLATIAHGRYRFDETIHLAKKAIKEANKADDIRHTIAGERLIGTAYKSMGKYDDADFHFQAALLLCEKYGILREKARLLLLHGWLKHHLSTLKKELPTEAEACFLEAMTVAQRIYDLYCLIEAKSSLGMCALARGATTEAKNWLIPIKDILPVGVHTDLRVGLSLGLAGISHQQGELETAGKLYQEISSFCKQHNLRIGLFRAMIGLGAVHWHSNRKKEAEKIWDQALKVAEQVSHSRRSLAEVSIERCRSHAHVTP